MEATFKERRNKVESKSNEGNEERSNGLSTYMPTNKMIREKVILKDKNRSSSMVGMGITMIIKMAMAANPIITSVFWVMKASRSRKVLRCASSMIYEGLLEVVSVRLLKKHFPCP